MVSYLNYIVLSSQSSHQSHDDHNNHNFRTKLPNNWSREPDVAKSPLRDVRTSSSYLDMSNDIMEVFYDGGDTFDDLSKNIDSFIQNVRSRTSEQDNTEGESFKDSYKSMSEPPWDQRSNSKREEGKDFVPKGYCGDYNSEGTLEGNFEKDPRYARENYQWKGKRERESLDSRDDFVNSKLMSAREGDLFEGTHELKEDIDLRLLHSVAGSKPSADRTEGSDSKSNNTRNLSSSSSSGDRLTTSIYDFDLRQISCMKTSRDTNEELGALPFKVPTHSAKEIDASMNLRTPIYYQMIPVDIPKPDFSRLKVNLDDPKTLEDPRLRKMLRKGSTDESPSSPRGAKFEAENAAESRKFENKLKFSDVDNRDPRRNASRDPRSDPKGLNRMDSRDLRADPRMDHRMTSRGDPRSEARPDPRMDPRGDPRSMSRFDPILEADVREADLRIGGPVFINSMMEAPNHAHFANIGSLSIDPRGRPGLLGPAPGQGPKNLPMGLPGQMPPNVGANPFLIAQGAGGGPQYMPEDRGDMLGGPGPTFPQSQWGSGGRGNFNDPRLNRDMGSFTSSAS